MTAGAEFLETAATLGRRLCRDAVWSERRCTWLGDALEPVDGTWSVVHRAAGADLYDGTAGIALFLATLYRVTREDPFRRWAIGGMSASLDQAQQRNGNTRVGFYSGDLGIAYSAIHCARQIDAPELESSGWALIRRIVDVAPANSLDVVGGIAGSIPPLLSLASLSNSQSLIEVGVRWGEHLLATAHRTDRGWSWDTLPGSFPEGTPHLTGLSHGTAGIGWALLELAARTGDARFAEAADQAFAYEQSWFSSQNGNWPDLRNAPAGSAYSLFWCHGAPGIGLSRLRAYQLRRGPRDREETEQALRTTVAGLQQSQGFAANYSLCHGVAGNAELLLEAGRTFGESEWRLRAEEVGRLGIARFDHPATRWPCGVPGGGETPGLMLGLAGIGYFYLRLFSPAEIPSLLCVGIETPGST